MRQLRIARRVSFAPVVIAGLVVLAACGTAGTAAGAGRQSIRTATVPVHAHRAASLAARRKQDTTGKSPVKHADFLTGVSCTSPSACVAVGWYYYGAKGPQRALVETWNGARWQVQALPANAQDGTLAAVSCPSVNSCTAVGSEILSWNGNAWSVQRRRATFDTVSCAAPSACVAIGENLAGKSVAGVEAGGSWHASRLPALPRYVQTQVLADVSCAAPDACLAVGSYGYGEAAQPTSSARTRILAERWNGSRWTIIRTLNVARLDQLLSVSCTGPRQCVAVGQARSQVTLAERWNGTSWQRERTPSFGKAGYSELTAVSCTSAAHCVALGDLNLATPHSEVYNGTSWTLRRIPAPQVVEPVVMGLAVSCTGTACELAGTFAGETLAESWNGSSWLLQVVPDPR